MTTNNNFTQTPQHEQAFELIAHTNASFFLTGKAGTGKTTFLRNVQEKVKKSFVVLAPTGIAALSAGGDTIHSFFGFPLHVLSPGTHGNGRKFEGNIGVIRKTDTFIIDEVSMVRCDIIDAIDSSLRFATGSKEPFGGKQMVFVGDIMQLKPVVTDDDKVAMTEYYGADASLFFQSNVLKAMSLPCIEFQKIFRQEDVEFKSILEEVRNGRMTPASVARLNERLGVAVPKDQLIITLASYRKTVEKINSMHLESIKEPAFTFNGNIDGDFPADSLPAPMELTLKKGAQVMFTHNDKFWVNGSLGTVTEVSNKVIKVKLDNGVVCPVGKTTWEKTKYKVVGNNIQHETVGSYEQFPLTLAWAVTIHKSQGLTFDNMILDLSRGVFTDGQLYVGLSRVRSLGGLYLTKPIKASYATCCQAALDFAAGYNNDELINSVIERERPLYEATHCSDPDVLTRRLFDLAEEQAIMGDYKASIKTVANLFKALICDNHLYNADGLVPTIDGDSATAKFLRAFFSLYACRYADAIREADAVLAIRQCKEALYIKSRALARQGAFAKADAVDVKILDIIGMAFDAKMLFAVGCVNEEIGDPGLSLLRLVVSNHKDYLPAAKALQHYAHKAGKRLHGTSNRLITLFNSDASGDDFAKAYAEPTDDELDEFLTSAAMYIG